MHPDPKRESAIRASNWRPLERNTLKGFLTLELPSGFILHECSFHRTAAGAEWIGLPGKPQLDRDGKQRKDPETGKSLYTPIIELKGKQQRERFQAAALDAVHELLGAMEPVP